MFLTNNNGYTLYILLQILFAQRPIYIFINILRFSDREGCMHLAMDVLCLSIMTKIDFFFSSGI